MENMELTHHGVKGMRWGVRRTPAQLGHKVAKKKKTSSVGDSLREGVQKLNTSFKKMKKRRVQQKNAERAREAKKTKEEYEAEKKKALESGTAADVLKFKGKLTNQELNNAVNRLNMESQLAQINARTVKTGMDKAENLMNNIGRMKDMAEKGISAWNTFAKVHNSLSPNDLPVIDGSYKDRKEAAAEKAAKKAEERARKAEEKKAKEITKIIETGTMQDISKIYDTLSISNRKAVTDRIKNDKKFTEYMDKLNGVSVADTGREQHRYTIKAGKDVIDRMLECE